MASKKSVEKAMIDAILRWSPRRELLVTVGIFVLLILTSCAIHYPPPAKRGEVPTPSVSPTPQQSPTASTPRGQATK